MTVKLQHLTIEDDERSWLRAPIDGEDALFNYTLRADLLSIVRHIMRDEPCDIIPIVRAFVTHPTNRHGHNAQVEVTYSRHGYRAIYGAHIGINVTNVQCYMD
jgi:hypothetical protein